MKLSDFKYPLPRNLIASYPAKPRDSARLMVLNRADETIDVKKFSDIGSFMKKGDCVVINETKVFSARLFGKKEKTNAKIEVFLLRELNKEEGIWDVIVDPARKVRIGNKIYFDDGKIWCEVIDNTTSQGEDGAVQHQGRSVQDHRADRDDAAALLHQADPGGGGQGIVPDHLRQKHRLGGGAHRRAPLHQAARRAPSRRKGVKFAPVTLHLGSGVVPAGRSRGPLEAQDGLRVLRDRAIDGGHREPDDRPQGPGVRHRHQHGPRGRVERDHHGPPEDRTAAGPTSSSSPRTISRSPTA